MKYWFKNVADNIYIYPKSTPRNLILQTRTSDCNSAISQKPYHKEIKIFIKQRRDVKIFLHTSFLFVYTKKRI